MRIYTKTGDSGTTSLFGGKRVGKDDLRIDAYGNVDELNSLLGFVIADMSVMLNENEESKRIDSSPKAQNDMYTEVINKLTRIQEELLVLGSDLSCPPDARVKVPRVSKVFITRLERDIDAWEKTLPQLKNFILPGGSPSSAILHLARSVTRRCERTIVKLARAEKINKYVPIYINRLSDWFFVLARFVNQLDGEKDVIWRGRKVKG